MHRSLRITIGLVTTLAAAAVVMTALDARTDDDTAAAADRPGKPGIVAVPDDGVVVARVVAAYVAPDELVLEPAELLTGPEAHAAAAEDGAEALDFYVRDHPDKRTTLPVAPDVAVTEVDCSAACVEHAPTDYGSFTRAADGTALHRLTIRSGIVVAIDEIYVS